MARKTNISQYMHSENLKSSALADIYLSMLSSLPYFHYESPLLSHNVIRAAYRFASLLPA